jgi:hypothetical protein
MNWQESIFTEYRICDIHDVADSCCGFLDREALWNGMWVTRFRRNILVFSRNAVLNFRSTLRRNTEADNMNIHGARFLTIHSCLSVKKFPSFTEPEDSTRLNIPLTS